jgi:hypothetical protein
MPNDAGYTCGFCGQHHDEVPLSYRTKAPVYWSSELESDPDSGLDDELCVINGEHFFVQGNIDIPIIGADGSDGSDGSDGEDDGVFTWGVWVSLSQANFARTVELWSTPGRESEPPYFGWLSTELPVYAPQSTLNLKTVVLTQPVGTRPLVHLEPTEHLLCIEQHIGITRERIQEIAQKVRHG